MTRRFDWRTKNKRRARKQPAASRRRRLVAEGLEDRRLLAVFMVTNTSGDPDEPGSLGHVIGDADRTSEHDTIVFDDSVFSTPQTIQLDPLGESFDVHFLVNNPLTIEGPGADLLTVDAGFGSNGVADIAGSRDGERIFEFEEGSQSLLSGMTLRGGEVDGFGGAIFNFVSLKLVDMVIEENFANDGGAIANFGILEVQRTTIRDNAAFSAFSSSAPARGGGIFNGGAFTLGQAFITDSLIAANSALSGDSDVDSFGGGVFTSQFSITEISNSTISANFASVGAGVINNGGLSLINSTVAQNISTTNAGSGIINSNVATLGNSIVAENKVFPDTATVDIAGTFSESSQFNLIGIADAGTGIVHGENGNLVGTSGEPIDPLLTPLANFGGPTLTHALTLGSPAIDGGTSTESFDQRGTPFTRNSGGGVDIGAYERQTLPASSLVVDSTSDESDGDFSAGQLTLREAIELANVGSVGSDTITFASPLFDTPQTIELTGELPTIIEDLVIAGPAADQLTLDANFQSRILSIALGADATITDLTMTRGDSGTANGGAIENLGVLTLERVAITDSRALGGSEPSEPGQGGAIYNSGPRFTSAQRLTIKDSTVSGNQARSSGAIFTRYASTSIENSTISGNSADNGGAITLSGGFGSTAITNSTITDNTATTSAAGIQKLSFSGGLSLGNTILSGNQLDDGTPSNLSGTGNLSGQFNLLGSGTTTFGSNQVVSDQPILGDLADNGGPTPTHALLPGSPAIDMGDPDFTTPPDFDQRGQGFARIVNGRIDVGALEAAVPEQLIVSTDTDEVDTDFSIGNLSLREAIGFANARPGPDTITFDEGLMGKTIVLESQLTVTDSITVNGLGADQLTIDGQSATRLFRLGKNDGPGTFRFDGLTLTGGFTTGFGGAFYLNDGFQGDDMLTITGSQLTGNTSALGGAISNVRNTVEIRDSSLIGNTASGPSGTRGGGAISNQAGNVFISDSTLGQNAAINKGGAIYSFTFEFQSGGPGANVTINNSTFAENQAAVGSSIYNESQLAAFNTSVSYTNTIFSDASPVDNIVASSIAGTATNTSFGFNLSDDDSGNLTGTGDQPSTDPRLASLVDNGGSMLTYGLLSDSPATNAGDPNFGLASRVAGAGVSSGTFNVFFDQRGAPFQRVVDNRLDIGAFETQTIDFGDAPDSYRTTTPDGASHQATGPRLGDDRDGEINGQPSLNADGDGDDEDGVMFGAIAVGAALAAVNVELQNATAAKVDAWIDFNHDGDWNDEGEQILTSRDVQGGLQTLNFNLPAGAIAGETYARVRVSTDGGLATTGSAPDGEVEDYRVSIVTAPVVEDVLINDGESNRSLVSSINVNFDREISASPSAFQLVNQDTNTVLTSLVVSTSVVDGKSVSRITFDPGPSVDTRADGVNSLADGNYLLTINGAEITDTGGVAMNGPYQFGGEEADLFYRLFGDSDGDGDVDGQDYGRFGSTFLKSDSEEGFNELFDADGDGDVDGQDYGNFGLRFLTTR